MNLCKLIVEMYSVDKLSSFLEK